MNEFDRLTETRDPSVRETLLAYLHNVDAHIWPGIDGLTVDTILASYPQAAVTGLVPDPAVLLQQHPEWLPEIVTSSAESQPSHESVVDRASPSWGAATLRAD